MACLCCCDLWRAWLLLGWPTESSPSLQIFLPLKFRLHALYIFKSQGHIVLQDWYLKDRNVLNAIKPKRRLSNVYYTEIADARGSCSDWRRKPSCYTLYFLSKFVYWYIRAEKLIINGPKCSCTVRKLNFKMKSLLAWK